MLRRTQFSAYFIVALVAACESEPDIQASSEGSQDDPAKSGQAEGSSVDDDDDSDSSSQSSSPSQADESEGSSSNADSTSGGDGDGDGDDSSEASDTSESDDGQDDESGSDGNSDDAGDDALDPLDPCTEPEVSRLRVWDIQSVGGTSIPDNWQDPVIEHGVAHAVDVEFDLPPSDGSDGANYGTINVPLANGREGVDGTTEELSVDLGNAEFLRLTHAADAQAFLQIRYGADAHGGHHFRIPLEPTDGDIEVVDLQFADFRRPDWAMTDADERVEVDDVFSLTFTTFQSVKWRIEGLQIPDYTPPCAERDG